MKTAIYDTHIRHSVIVEEAQAQKLDLFSWRKKSTVSEDYGRFVDEYLSKLTARDDEKN